MFSLLGLMVLQLVCAASVFALPSERGTTPLPAKERALMKKNFQNSLTVTSPVKNSLPVKEKGKENLDFSFNGAKTIDGLVLKQEFRFIGKCTTYFTDMGLRLDSATVSIIYNAKNHRLLVFSDDTKKFYECDGATWKKKSFILFRKGDHYEPLGPWKYVKDDGVAGFKTKVYAQKTKISDGVNEDVLWLTKEVSLPADARSLLLSLLKVTQSVPEGIPVRHQLVSKHKEMRQAKDFVGRSRMTKKPDKDVVDYQTYSSVKAKIPISKFAMSGGYTRAESEMEVFFSSDDSLGAEIPELDPSLSSKSKSRLPKP